MVDEAWTLTFVEASRPAASHTTLGVGLPASTTNQRNPLGVVT